MADPYMTSTRNFGRARRPTTLFLDACREIGILAPINLEEMFIAFRRLKDAGIRHSMMEEPIWRQWDAAVITTSASYV